MAQLGVQFHADLGELLGELLPRWLAGYEVDVVLKTADERGKVMLRVDLGDVHATLKRLDRVSRVNFLYLREGCWPDEVHGMHPVDFLGAKLHHGAMSVKLPRVTADGVDEAMLGVISDDPEVLVPWRRMVGRARRGFMREAMYVSWDKVDEAVPLKQNYSPGACRLSQAGVKLIATSPSHYWVVPGHVQCG